MDALPGLGYRTNNRSDQDRLKHQLPFNMLHCFQKKGSLPCRAVFSNQSLYEYNIRGKYDALIIIVDSPAHAIFSLYSRHYERSQYQKLNHGMAQNTFPTTWDKNATAVFDASANAGNNVFGIERFMYQWMDLQDMVTFGFYNTTLTTPERQTFRELSSNSDDYLQGVVNDFLPIFITDIATTRAAPAIFATLLGVTVNELESVSGATKNKEKSKAENKLTKEQEHGIVQTAGATQIYARLEREIQQRIKQNYLLFAVAMFCSTPSNNTL